MQERGFTDGRQTAVGSTGEHTPRNAPGLANVAWFGTYTWANPALTTLERQMEGPMFGEHPIEMGVTDANRPEILARLRADPNYPQRFKEAFPEQADPFNFANIIKAIAAFERGLTAVNSRYDRYLLGKVKLSAKEQRGMSIFFGERGECHHCHNSSNFNDQFMSEHSRATEMPFHNTGIYNIDGKGGYPYPNRGVFELSGEPADMGRFRAPSLRNVAVTAPYMHDGSAATLKDVLDIYSQGGRLVKAGAHAGDGRSNPFKSDLIVRIGLTQNEKEDLIAFLKTLTDETFLTSTRYADPYASRKKVRAGR